MEQLQTLPRLFNYDQRTLKKDNGNSLTGHDILSGTEFDTAMRLSYATRSQRCASWSSAWGLRPAQRPRAGLLF